MGVSLGPFGKTVVWGSALLFVWITLYVVATVGVSGLFLGSVLYLLWAGLLRATVFISGNDEVVYVTGDEDKGGAESANEQPPVPVPEDPSFPGGAEPARDVGPAVSRIIGEDARRQVLFAQATTYRDSPTRSSDETSAEDREFADFLRSTRF